MTTFIKPIIENNSKKVIYADISLNNISHRKKIYIEIIKYRYNTPFFSSLLLHKMSLQPQSCNNHYPPVVVTLEVEPDSVVYYKSLEDPNGIIEVSIDNVYSYDPFTHKAEHEHIISSVEIFDTNKPKFAGNFKIMETRPQMTLEQYLKASLKDPVEVKFAQEVLNCIGTQPNFISDVPIDTLKQILNDKDNMIYRWVCIDEDRWLSRQVCGCYNISDLKYNMGFLDPKYKMKNAVKHILFAPFEPFIQPNTVYSTSMENFTRLTEEKTVRLTTQYGNLDSMIKNIYIPMLKLDSDIKELLMATEKKLEPKLSTENSYQEAVKSQETNMKDKPQQTEMTFKDFLDVLEYYFEDNRGNIYVGKAAENFLTMAAPRHLSYKWVIYGHDVLGKQTCWSGIGKIKTLVENFNSLYKNNDIEYVIFSIASETNGSIHKTVNVLTTQQFLDIVVPVAHIQELLNTYKKMPNRNATLEALQSRTKIREEVMPDVSAHRTSENFFIQSDELDFDSDATNTPIHREENMKVIVNVENNDGCFIMGIGQPKNLSDEQKHSIKEFAMAMDKQNSNHSLSQVVFNFKAPGNETEEPCTTVSVDPDSNLHIFIKENINRWSENTLKLNDFFNDFFGPKTTILAGIIAQRTLIESEKEEEYCKWLIIGNFHNELDIEEILDPLNDLDLKSFCNHLSENGICLDKVIYVAFERPSNDEALYILTPDELLESLDTIQATIADQFKKRSLNIKNLR